MLKIYEIYDLFISFSYIFSRFQELGPQNASRLGRLRPLSDAVELRDGSPIENTSLPTSTLKS